MPKTKELGKPASSRKALTGWEDAAGKLDRGRYAEAIARLAAERMPDGSPAAAIWRADVLLYLDRRDAARTAALRLEELDVDDPWRIRGTVILAETAFAEGDLHRAEGELAKILGSPVLRERPELLARVWWNLGRIGRSRGEFAQALEQLLLARQYAQVAGSHYMAGLVAYNRGFCWHELGNAEIAESCFQEALGLLSETEDLRYRAIAQSAYSSFLFDVGRNAEALALATEAERTAVELGVHSDVLRAGVCGTRALMNMGRYDEALRRTRALLGVEATRRIGAAELAILLLQSVAAHELGDYNLAAESAAAARELAVARGDQAGALEADLLAARAGVRAGDPGAIAELRAQRERVDASGNERLRIDVRLALAEALVPTAPVEAASLCEEARAFPVAASNPKVLTEIERVERLVNTAPIRVEAEGVLQIDVRTQWPSLKTAREALERFLITKAVEASGGNLAAAGRLIGETRFQMHYLWKMMNEAPPRPALSASAAAKSRKRRPRNLFSDRRKRGEGAGEKDA